LATAPAKAYLDRIGAEAAIVNGVHALFARQPDVMTAAHEAIHVAQQQEGPRDWPYRREGLERQADEGG
jgi:hypothetical protein